MDARAYLRLLAKEVQPKPISRMSKKDVSAQIEKLEKLREMTASSAAVPSVASRRMEPAAESVKEAKAAEFPVAPGSTKKGMERKTARKAYEPKAEAAPAPKKKMTKKEMMALIAELSSDEE